MSITCHWIKDNQTTEFTVTLVKPLKDCTIDDFNKSAFAASHDQINNVAYVGTVPQKATADRTDTVWFNTSNSIDFSTLHFSAKSDSTFYRRTLVLAVPQHTEISSFTQQDLDDYVYLVSDIQALNKVALVNSVQYRNDFLRTQLKFSQPLKHCLNNAVFSYDTAAELITDGTVSYQLIPVFLYVVNNRMFITQNEPYSPPCVDNFNTVCGFISGISCFDDPDIKLCLGVNPNDRSYEIPVSGAYHNNIIESVQGDMLNIYDCPSLVNADIRLSIYSEQDSLKLLYLQRGVLLNSDCYTACASQYGFIFVNNITNEIYEPAMRDGIVEGYKELVYNPVKFRLLSNNNSNNQLRTVPPVSDAQISNEREYYTVGVGVIGRWQVRKCSVNDTEHQTLVEDFGDRAEFTAAYIEADGDFDYFAGQEHLSLVTEGLPWLVVIRAADKHMYVKKVNADVSTAVLLDTDVEQASVCRGWKSDKYDVDSGLIVAYIKATGAYMRAYYKINGTYTWDTVQILSGAKFDRIEVKRLNDFRIGIYTYSKNELNQVWLSPRYYIGGTSKTEYLTPKYVEEFRVWSVTQQDGSHDDLKIENVELKDGREFWVTANYPFVWRDNTWNDITAVKVASGFSIESYRIEDGYLIIRMNKAYESPYIHAEFRIKALNRIQFKRTNHSIPICPELDIIVDNPAKGYVTEQLYPNVSGVICTFVAKTMTTYRGNHTENLQPSVSIDATFVAKEMTTYRGTTTETLMPRIDNISCTLVVEQTGVTPV